MLLKFICIEITVKLSSQLLLKFELLLDETMAAANCRDSELPPNLRCCRQPNEIKLNQ